MQYNELNVRVEPQESGGYRVFAWGATGEATGALVLPFSDLELENFVLRIGRTRRGTRRLESPEMQRARDFGGRLFDSLFTAQVRDLYRDCFASARTDGKGLRVKLSLGRTPELTDLPWEFLYDTPAFLSISQFTPVIRYLDLPRARTPLAVELPLRVLAMISAPHDEVALDVEDERQKVELALRSRELVERDLVEITWVEQASLRALQRELRRGPYHVFHFIGHGGYDPGLGESVLLLEDDDGRARRVSGTQIGTILADHTSLRLAVLNACEGARTSRDDPFSGVAAALVQHGLPAVIAMQFEITDRAAIIFAEELYTALVEGLPVDAALAEARKAIYGDGNDIEWGTPVLFMRVPDGRVFEMPTPTPVPATGKAPRAPSAILPAVDEPTAEERHEAERLARERAEAEQLAREQAEREEAERAARERAEQAERDEAARQQAEAEQLAREQAEREEAERAARERAEQAERERAEQAEREQARQRAEAEQLAREQAEREEAERTARERAEEAEREEAEQAARERAEAELFEREVAEPETEEGVAALDVSPQPTGRAGSLARRLATGLRRRRGTAALVGAALALIAALGIGGVLYFRDQGAPLSRIPVALRQDCKDYGYYYWTWETNVPSEAFVSKKLCQRDIEQGASLFVPLAYVRSSSELDQQYEAMLRALPEEQASRRYRTSRASGRFFIGKAALGSTLVWTDEPGRVIGTVSYGSGDKAKPEKLVRDWKRYVVLGRNLEIEESSMGRTEAERIARNLRS